MLWETPNWYEYKILFVNDSWQGNKILTVPGKYMMEVGKIQDNLLEKNHRKIPFPSNTGDILEKKNKKKTDAPGMSILESAVISGAGQMI